MVEFQNSTHYAEKSGVKRTLWNVYRTADNKLVATIWQRRHGYEAHAGVTLVQSFGLWSDAFQWISTKDRERGE